MINAFQVLFLFLLITSKLFGAEVSNRIIPEEVRSISYLLASNKGVGKSSFGHAYIRISYGDALADSDIVIEFVADVEEGKINYLRGIGMGENYEMKIIKTKYSQVHQHHALHENRDLTSYVLKINEEEKVKIVTKLNELLNVGLNEKYSFFKNNCASVVSQILNNVLGRPIEGLGSVIPTSIPKLLKQHGFVRKEVFDPRRSVAMKRLVEKYLPDSLKRQSGITFANIKESLSSPDLSQRVNAYFKMKLLRSSLSHKEKVLLSVFVAKFIPLEGYVIRQKLSKYFGSSKTELIEFAKFQKRISSHCSEISRSSIKVKGASVLADVAVRCVEMTTDNKRKIRYHTYSFPLKGLRYKDGRIVDKNNYIIAYQFSKNNVEEEFYHSMTSMSTELISYQGKKYISSVFVYEKSGVEKTNAVEYGLGDELSYSNEELSKIDSGVCLSHAMLSQKLKTNAFFAPDLKPLPASKALKLVQAVYRDEIVIIPGYENSRDFTASLPLDELSENVTAEQKKHIRLQKGVESYFKATDLNSENVFYLKNMLSLGVAPIILFRTRGVKAHSVLVTEVAELESEFVLSVIDPGMGYQKSLYKLSKKTSLLDTVFYGKVKPMLFHTNLKKAVSSLSLVRNSQTQITMKHFLNLDGKSSYRFTDFY